MNFNQDENQYLHEVAVTAIIIKDRKYLITRRSPNKKRFPGMWTVPGGKVETSDYLKLPKDTEFYWYNVLEKTLKREVKEEVGIEIDNIEYVTSLATVHLDGCLLYTSKTTLSGFSEEKRLNLWRNTSKFRKINR